MTVIYYQNEAWDKKLNAGFFLHLKWYNNTERHMRS